MKKPSYLKDAIAKVDGFYSAKGEKLKSQILSEEFCNEWNGVKKAAPKKAEPVVEEAPVEEVKETVVQKLTKKVRRKK